ncbi:Phosphoheptose isomerase [Paraburkholderia ribeironis]|uniref:Phosphoheptose isomerase n=1 Tax=Paraburkholderia ribeironis TaxID=1247936 RepID=A0A1N7RSZ2_9BURK|nr:SIS domain-containing protein [Paraburkholderia ribeironis]SIT38218.1 Phosphoheptose isomerase [Paraburkholderia ribeironis]
MSSTHLLVSLYPHLGDETNRRAELVSDALLLEAVATKSAESIATHSRFFEANGEAVLKAAHLLANAFRDGKRLYTFGNGGSSSDASHVAVEFSHPATVGRPALPAQNLAQDTALVTAIGNDVGITEIYARQLMGLARPGDIALGLSTSGNSRNVLRGLEEGHRLGARTVALVGGDGGEMARAPFIDCCLTVRSQSVHRIQEAHVVIYHVLWDLVHTLLANNRVARCAQS